MEITEVRIKLMQDPDDRLRAFCSITFDDAFVVRDLKIIDGTTGPFVAMPSRKLTCHCSRCGYKNHIRASYCNQCGAKQSGSARTPNRDGRAKLYADIAHPINSRCRELIQNHVISAFEQEKVLAAQPGYTSSYDDNMDYDPSGQVEGTGKSPLTTEETVLRRADQPSVPGSTHHPAKHESDAPRSPNSSVGGDGEFGAGLG